MLRNNCVGIVFFATPHSGSGIATFLQNFRSLLRLTVPTQELIADSPALRDLNEWFRVNCALLRIKTQIYVEKQQTLGVRVVAESSADPGLSDSTPIPLDANHVNITKFSFRSYFPYIRIRHFLVDSFSLQTTQDEALVGASKVLVSISPGRSTRSDSRKGDTLVKLKEVAEPCFPQASEEYPAGSRIDYKAEHSIMLVLSRPSVAVRGAIEFMQKWHAQVLGGQPDCAIAIDIGPLKVVANTSPPVGEALDRVKWFSQELEPGIFLSEGAAKACDRTMALFSNAGKRHDGSGARVTLFKAVFDDPRTVHDSALVHALFVAPKEASAARNRLFELFYLEFLSSEHSELTIQHFRRWAKRVGYPLPADEELVNVLGSSQLLSQTESGEFVLTKTGTEQINDSRREFVSARDECNRIIRESLAASTGDAGSQIGDLSAITDRYLSAIFLEIRLLANYFKRGYEIFDSAPEGFARFDYILTEHLGPEVHNIPVQTWRRAFIAGLQKAAKADNAYIAATFHNVLATYYLNRNAATSPYQLKRLEHRVVYLDTKVLYALKVAASNYHEQVKDMVSRLRQLGVTIKVFPFTVDEYEASLNLVIKHHRDGQPDSRLVRWNPWLFQEFKLRAGRYMGDISVCREVHRINRRTLVCEPSNYDEVDRVLSPLGVKLEREFTILSDETVDELWTEYSHQMPSNAWPLDEYWDFLYRVSTIPMSNKRHDIFALFNVQQRVNASERDEIGPKTVFLTLDSRRLLRLRRILRYIVAPGQLLDFFLPYLFLNDIPLLEAESFPNRLLSAQLGTLLVKHPPELVDLVRAFVEDGEGSAQQEDPTFETAEIEAVAAAMSDQRFAKIVVNARNLPTAERSPLYEEVGAAVQSLRRESTAAFFQLKRAESEVESLKAQLEAEVQKRQKAEGKAKYLRSMIKPKR